MTLESFNWKQNYRKNKANNYPIKRYRRCAKDMIISSERIGIVHAAIFFRSVKQQWLDYAERYKK